MALDITYHYPPELFELLVNAIPRLIKSKQGVLDFFKGAGIADLHLSDLRQRVLADRQSINKFEITRTVLKRINDPGEKTLRERREVLKRIVEWEDFSTCWPTDEAAAKGHVGDIQKIVNVKDSFTRMNLEREAEVKKHQRELEKKKRDKQKKEQEIASVYTDLCALFSEKNVFKRGKALEGVLNRLFGVYGISVREAFALVGSEKEGIVEQVDGVIELDGHLYFVEMKWWSEPIGRPIISDHLVRVYHRGQSRGMFFSASKYTEPAITVSREALQRTVFILCELEEIVRLLEKKHDLKKYLREKIQRAGTDKNPLHFPEI